MVGLFLAALFLIQSGWSFEEECQGGDCITCPNGEVILQTKLCDGQVDCPGGNDEMDELCRFSCNDTYVIDRIWKGVPVNICDFVNQCDNGRDEENCDENTACINTIRNCANHHDDLKCGEPNTAVLTDQGTITTKSTSRDGYECKVWPEQFPNHPPENHCGNPDGDQGPWCFVGEKWDFCYKTCCTDPLYCHNHCFECPMTSEFVSRENICDGTVDCYLGTDEARSICMFECKDENNTVVRRLTKGGFGHVCNGVVDCPNEADEVNCGVTTTTTTVPTTTTTTVPTTTTLPTTTVPITTTTTPTTTTVPTTTTTTTVVTTSSSSNELETLCMQFTHSFYHGSSCFITEPESIPHGLDAAGTKCNHIGPGHLAFIGSQETQMKLENLTLQLYADMDPGAEYQIAWIGLEQTSSIEPDGGWSWVHPDRRVWDLPTHLIVPWMPYQPNNQNYGWEGCLFAKPLAGSTGVDDCWDVPGESHPYICEYEAEVKNYKEPGLTNKFGHPLTTLLEVWKEDRQACSSQCNFELPCRAYSFKESNGWCILHFLPSNGFPGFEPEDSAGYVMYDTYY